MLRTDVRRRIDLVAKATWSVAPEIATASALVGGWVLITLAVANIAPVRITYEVSGGIFLLSCFGWRVLAIFALNGLYALSANEKGARRA